MLAQRNQLGISEDPLFEYLDERLVGEMINGVRGLDHRVDPDVKDVRLAGGLLGDH
jgi:hypothetical protein